ncbi:haloalkane dehalogenase [Luteitalea pratensis]|uniref:Haloalkane dehalogenase n=1 Tax=Luteitalea pratensis TaxID=1855912 RepID=A0A143PJC6_LUTPR|nr:alpha/beta hydrolase [Luteitalea pratensis]AMY08340.1 haloalkane dehalogenase [Luteitalea pratensis]
MNGNLVQVRILGPPDGRPGHPVVVFESGVGTGLIAWSPVLPDVARFATVVAYDRAGIGGSEADGPAPTPRHIAERLHALLDELGLKPPYVLVGHSWGGLLIRMYTAIYPADVGGLVYVDPTDPRSEAEDLAYLRASGYTADGARQCIDKRAQEMAEFVGRQTGQYRAEMDVIRANELNHSAEFLQLPPLPDVPVALLVSNRFSPQVWAGRPCEPPACHAHWLRQRLAALTRLAPAGAQTSVTLTEAGHDIQHEEPSLVVDAIGRVLATSKAR